jgi:membrane protein
MKEHSLIKKIQEKFNELQHGILAPLLDVVQGYSRHGGGANSAYIAFYLILSLFPFLLAMVAVISYLPWDVSEYIGEMRFFPPDIEHILQTYVLNIRLNSGILLVYSIVVALWGSSRAVTSLRFSLDQVYANKAVHFVKTKLFAMLYNLVFIFILVVAFSLPAVVDLIYMLVQMAFGDQPLISGLFTWLRWILLPVTLPVILALIYMRVPSQKLKFSEVWPGTIFTTVSWILLSNLFPLLVSTTRNALYGALNTFILMALFFKFLAQTLIYGAEINRVYSSRGGEKSVSAGS